MTLSDSRFFSLGNPMKTALCLALAIASFAAAAAPAVTEPGGYVLFLDKDDVQFAVAGKMIGPVALRGGAFKGYAVRIPKAITADDKDQCGEQLLTDIPITQLDMERYAGKNVTDHELAEPGPRYPGAASVHCFHCCDRTPSAHADGRGRLAAAAGVVAPDGLSHLYRAVIRCSRRPPVLAVGAAVAGIWRWAAWQMRATAGLRTYHSQRRVGPDPLRWAGGCRGRRPASNNLRKPYGGEQSCPKKVPSARQENS